MKIGSVNFLNGKFLAGNLLAGALGLALIIPSIANADELVIGGAISLTGSLAYADVPAQKGMQLAIDEINAAGGIPADNVQATVSAKYAFDTGYKTAYILVSPDTAYTQLPLYFKAVFEKLGGKVIAQDNFSMGQQDFGAQVTKIKALSPAPDVIMTAAYEPDFPAFIKQLRAAGVTIPVIGSDGIDSPTTFALGNVAEGVVFSTAGFAAPGSPLEAYNVKYKAKYGSDPDTIYTAIGYDLIKVLEAAVLKAGSTDRAAIWQAVRELENVQGATSTITYKGTNGIPLRQVALIKIVGGQRQLVRQEAPDAALIPTPKL